MNETDMTTTELIGTGTLLALLASPLVSSASSLHNTIAQVDTGIQIGISVTPNYEATTTNDTATITGLTDNMDVSAEAMVDYEDDDEYVASATVHGDDEVNVEYWHEGRLFGLFPVKVKSDTVVEIDSAGLVDVKTRMPWWNMFVIGTGNVVTYVQEDLENSESVAMDIRAEGDMTAKERILDAIIQANASVRLQIAR